MQPRPFSTASALASFPAQDSQEESFYLASVRQWTDQDVATWLTGCKCAAYAPLFRQNDLCGEVILDLTQASLKEMGITSVGDRARILVAVKQLRQKCYASTSTSTAARRTTMPPGGWLATRRYSVSAPTTPFFSPTGAISETAPVTPGSAPFYAPTGAIYFSPLPEMDIQSEDSPATQTSSAPGFSGLAATSATPAIRIQNPSPLESSSDRSRLADPANREVQEATKWGVFGSNPLPPPAPSLADSQAPPSPDNEIRSSAPAQQASLETKRRDPISTPAPLPPHMTHGRKLSRRHGQLYIVATPPPPTVQSLKAY